MLKISWFEFFVRGIPEEFLVVLAAHAFSKTGIELKRYLLSGTILWILASSIRYLPIQFGIHTLLSLMALIILVTIINKIDINKSILAGFITIILEFTFEGLNIFFINFLLNINLANIMINPTLKTLYGMPSVILFGIVIVIYYIRLSKRKELKYM